MPMDESFNFPKMRLSSHQNDWVLGQGIVGFLRRLSHEAVMTLAKLNNPPL